MKRQHLIIIAVVVFALFACTCLGAVGLFVLWPSPDDPGSGGGSRYASDIDRLVGVWQCTSGNSNNPEGATYQFFTPDEGTTGSVYLTNDPDSGEEWIEAEYEFTPATGYLVLSPVSYGLWAVSSSYAVEFSGDDTLLMRSMDAGDEGERAARFERVE